jgi:hypothetical protein
MSGTLENVTELLLRFTTPSSVRLNGAGNVIASVGAVTEPPSVTVPFSVVGTKGEVAVAVPTMHPVPLRHWISAAALGVKPDGNVTVMALLADSSAACVTSVFTSAPPFESLVTAAVRFGE